MPYNLAEYSLFLIFALIQLFLAQHKQRHIVVTDADDTIFSVKRKNIMHLNKFFTYIVINVS